MVRRELGRELCGLDFLIGWTCKLWGFGRGMPGSRVPRRVTCLWDREKGHWNIGQCLVMLVILFNGSSIHTAFINA